MESKEGIEALFLYATEGILVINEKGVIVSINPAAEKLFGYERDELTGTPIETLIPSRFAGKHQHHRDHYNTSPHPRSMGKGMDLYGLKKDGTEFPVEISLSPYSNDDGKFVIAFIIDITIRKQAEEKLRNYSGELEQQVKNRTMILEEAIEELEKTKADLNEALAKEKDLNELKSRFVSMASHEFRTPLAAILSSLSLVKRYGELNDKEKQEKHVNRIKEAINNLTGILNDFLSISKLEEGRTECVKEEFDLPSFIEEFVPGMEQMAPDNIKIAYHHSGDVICFLDRKLLTNILINLVSNAIKFSPKGGTIKIRTNRDERSVTLSVTDDGIGISETDQKHLFERFFRGQNATHIQGTGLGLNIVARYTEMMGGTVEVESKENNGTTFILTFEQ